jgi:hypothetical protein
LAVTLKIVRLRFPALTSSRPWMMPSDSGFVSRGKGRRHSLISSDGETRGARSFFNA